MRPTWNYLTAHVYGRLIVHDDPAWVEDVVRRLTAKHEAARLASPGQRMPWSPDDAPRKFIEGQLRAIVGLELQITRIEANQAEPEPPGHRHPRHRRRPGRPRRGADPMATAVEHANANRVAYKHHGSFGQLKICYGGDDVRGHHLQRGHLPDVGYRAATRRPASSITAATS